MTSNSVLRIAALGGMLLGLAACDATDPYKRIGMWRPMGANDANFELQVARASDLVQGRGTDEADGHAAAMAIDRLRADKVRRLPQTGLSSVGSQSPATADGAK